MNFFWAIILGVVQGLTEFFPVSSSAHLTLFPWIFKFEDPGLAFDIALHAGTFFAILFALMRDFLAMAKSFFKKESLFEKKLIGFLALTSIPGAVFGYFLEDQAATTFRSPLLVAFTLLAFGMILWFVDHKIKKNEKIEKMTAKKSFFIGLSQALAIIPGVSRSGATITAGRALGFSREAAVRYSFLAALPIIFGATAFGLRNVSFSEFTSTSWILGFLSAFISSFLAIKWFLVFSKKKNFDTFVYYRVTFALVIIFLILAGGYNA